MNNLPQIFNYEGQHVRTVSINGEPWFVAKDICDILEIVNSRDAVSRLDEDEKGVVLTDTLGGTQEIQAVNEPGLYSLILGSRKPEAKQFKRWITHEVLPQIRQTGSYIDVTRLSPELAMFNQMFQAVAKMQLTQQEQAQELTQITGTVQSIKETIIQRDDNWRDSINRMINKVAQASGKRYDEVRVESYVLLEERGGCDLIRRAKNLRERMFEAGETKTAINKANRLDVIETDKRLKEIYTQIVKEMTIAHVS